MFGAALAVLALGSTPGARPPAVQPPAPTLAQPAVAASANAQANFDEARRLYERTQYTQAIPFLDTVVSMLAPAAATLSPADRDLLVETYKLRARARFNESLSGVEEDFAALFALRPSAAAGDMSPKTEQLFNAVKKRLVGQVRITLSPVIEATIDNQPYTVDQLGQPMEMLAGEHVLAASRLGYRPLSQPFTVVAGQLNAVTAALERVSATLAISTIPDAVEVVVDNVPRGLTAKGQTAESSEAFIVGDLAVGRHTILLRRACYKDLPLEIEVKQPEDLEMRPQRLVPAVASVKIESSDRAAVVFLDDVERGRPPVELSGICEGAHVIDIRSPRGRFIDRRTWRAGDAVQLTADLRAAFAIVSASVGGSMPPAAFKASVERALSAAKRVLVYVPSDGELEKALREEGVPSDWLGAELGRGTPRAMSRDTRRDLGRKLAARLNSQGVAAVASSDSDLVTLSLLAAGSGEADVLSFNLRDPASYGGVADTLGGPLPRLVKPSLETSTIDVSGLTGAAVVRVDGAGARAGLVPGDVIVGVGSTPIGSVADLRSTVMAMDTPAALTVQVKTLSGTTKAATLTPVLVADTLPMRDASLVYNRLLIDLQDLTKTAAGSVDLASARLNLAVVHMRLGNWEDAIRELQQVDLKEGPGVSAGTVHYLLGVSHEALGRMADAQAEFTKAAAAGQARLRDEGPLVSALARQKLRTLKP